MARQKYTIIFLSLRDGDNDISVISPKKSSMSLEVRAMNISAKCADDTWYRKI